MAFNEADYLKGYKPSNRFDEKSYLGLDDEEKARKGYLKEGVSFLTDIAIAEGGRVASSMTGAAIGSAILPGFGTVVGGTLGYIAGGLGAGAAGSIARQKMFDKNAEVSEGQVVADAILNLVPGLGIGKRVMTKAAAQAGIGASMSVGGQLIERAIEEGRLPTQEELTISGLTGAALGGALGLSGSASERIFGKFLGNPIDNINAAIRAGDPDAKTLIGKTELNAQDYIKERQKVFDEFYLRNREKYDDEFVRIKQFQDIDGSGQIKKRGNLKVQNDAMNFEQARTNAEGIIDAKLNQLGADISLNEGFVIDTANNLGIRPEQISREVNDYLYAKHAVDYNRNNFAKFGDDGAAGMSTERANKIIKNFEDAGKQDTYAFSIKVQKDLSKQILDTLEDGQLISKADADKLRQKAPNYVPLNRIMEDDSIDDIGTFVNNTYYQKYETTDTGLKRAKGSNLEVGNIQGNIVNSLMGAIRRAEVNKANLAFKRLIEANPEDSKLIAISRPAKVDPRTATLVDGNYVPNIEKAQEHMVTVFDQGKKSFIDFNDKDPNMIAAARAMKGLGRRQVSDVMKWSLTANKVLGGLYTRYNPEFVLPNVTRDRSEAFVTAIRKMGPMDALPILNPVNGMRTIYRGLTNANAFRKNPELMNADDLLYKRFQDAGGSTGGLAISTLDSIEDNASKLTKSLTTPAKSKVKFLNKLIEGANEIAEDATRFSTFKAGLKNGMTDAQAAFSARTSTFDPRMGGTETDNLKALYLFVNPAIQSGKNFLRGMSKPSVFTGVMAGLGTISTTLDMMNSMVDEDYREKIPQWKLDKSLVLVTGKNEDGTLNYKTVPIGYSMVPFKIAADMTVQLFKGKEEAKNPEQLANRLYNSIMDSYNPIGGSPIPTQLRPIVDLLSNKDGLGRPIRPEWMETINMDPTERYFDHTAETYGGEMYLGLADSLKDMGMPVSPENIQYLTDNYLGGPVKFGDRLATIVSKLYNGEKVSLKDAPIARRFIGQTYANTVERRSGQMTEIDNLDRQANTSSVVAGRVARQALKEMRENPNRTDSILQTALRNNPDMQESILRRVQTGLKDEARGLTYVDRAAKRLPVEQRAKYIFGQLNQQPDEESKRKLIRELIGKGIATKSVLKELLQLQGQ